MPFTKKQREFFHVADENSEVAREHGMEGGEARKLADEADKLRKQGKERAPVKKADEASAEQVYAVETFGSAPPQPSSRGFIELWRR